MFPLCGGVLRPLALFSVLKGIIWLLFATVAGVPPTASSASFLAYLLSHCSMNDPGIHFLESERYCYSLSYVTMRDTELNAIFGISSVQHRTFLLIYCLVVEAFMLRLFRNTDVSAPRGDHKYNRCDTDISLSGRLYLRVHRHVLHSSIPFFTRAHYCRWFSL